MAVSERVHPLLKSVTSNDYDGVRTLLMTGCDPNDAGGIPPILSVLSADVSRLLVSFGADVNTIYLEETALTRTLQTEEAYFIPYGSKYELVRELLKLGADPNLAGGSLQYTDDDVQMTKLVKQYGAV